MINYNKEYFNNNSYFFLKDKGDKIALYYSVADTLNESRKTDEKVEFDKKDAPKIKSIIHKILNSKNKMSKKQIEKELNLKKPKGEIEELIDADGGMLGSSIPNLNQALHPRKTMDQTIAMSRVTNDPVTRGYRVYWGESEEKDDNVVSEVDYSDAFGYEETKDKDFKQTVKILKKMGVENPLQRAAEMGKSPKLDKKKKKGAFVRQRLSEKESIIENKNRVRFYNEDGKWFSSSESLSSVPEHKKRFGNNIKFSVDGYDGLFNTISDFKEHQKNKKEEDISSGFMFGDSDAAKERIKLKRQKRLSEKESIEEQQKKKMIKMVEDILAKKSKENSDVVKKEKGISKILMKNLQSIKHIAEKEGISLNQLIKALKNDE